MALLCAALAQPFSPRAALPVRHPPTSLTGSGLSLDFSLPPHPGLGAPQRAYPRIEATARRGARTESAKVRNRRLQKKFNGTATKPRLSVFCSNRQLYAVLADDHNKKILFYGSTLQKSICGDPPCGTVEAARRVGEELVRVCNELGISEVSYDRNGFAQGDKMMAFEVPVSQHGSCQDRLQSLHTVVSLQPPERRHQACTDSSPEQLIQETRKLVPFHADSV